MDERKVFLFDLRLRSVSRQKFLFNSTRRREIPGCGNENFFPPTWIETRTDMVVASLLGQPLISETLTAGGIWRMEVGSRGRPSVAVAPRC